MSSYEHVVNKPVVPEDVDVGHAILLIAFPAAVWACFGGSVGEGFFTLYVFGLATLAIAYSTASALWALLYLAVFLLYYFGLPSIMTSVRPAKAAGRRLRKRRTTRLPFAVGSREQELPSYQRRSSPSRSLNVLEAPDVARFDSLLSTNTYAIVQFYSDRCAYSQSAAEFFSSLADRYSVPGRLAFVSVRADRIPELSERHGVSKTPTYLVFADGQPTAVPVANPAPAADVKLAGGDLVERVYGDRETEVLWSFVETVHDKARVDEGGPVSYPQDEVFASAVRGFHAGYAQPKVTKKAAKRVHWEPAGVQGQEQHHYEYEAGNYPDQLPSNYDGGDDL